MRKTWIIACAAAAAALAGCNRETQGPVAVGNVFRASIETPSRVAFSDEGAFSWQAGDAVAVSTNAGFKTFTLKEGAGASVAAFDGDLAGVTSATVAVYPASIAKADATVTLPAEYAWTEGQTNAAMYCDAVDLAKVNSFKHLGGIIKVTFAEIPAEADAMVLKAEAKITGDFAIADGKIAAGAGTDEVKVTFTAGSNPAAFYIPVPTGEYKFAVELQAAGVTIEKSVKATSKAIKIDRKALVLMDPVGGPVKVTIATAEDFLAFAPDANDLPAGSEAVLTADIVLPETFEPDTLGCDFDGQGHKVTYVLNAPAGSKYHPGLFSRVTADHSVKNVKVAGAINGEQDILWAGGIAGTAGENVLFENCESEVNITYNVYGEAVCRIGGIVGVTGKGIQIKGCHNKGNITNVVEGPGRATNLGGIIGHVEGSASNKSTGLIEDTINDGDITYGANGTPRIGGIVGYVNYVSSFTYKNCVNNGNLTSKGVPTSGYSYLGGISGYYGTAQAGSEVLYDGCVNNGKVEAEEGTLQTRMGGILGHGGLSGGTANSMTWTVKDCTNNGDIISAGTVAKNHIGGIISMVETSCKIVCDGCTNNAKVSVAGAGAAGGILGNTCGTQSTFTNVTVTEASVIETKGSGQVGLIIAKPSAITSAVTGKVGAAKIVKGETETVATADNYQDLLMGGNLGEGANTDGVVFEGGSAPAAPTIKDFAQEFVKILDVWESTTGEGVMHSSVAAIPNAHLIPADTKITVGGKEYSTADMMETAMRSYMLIRGYNGLDTENYGAGKIAALEGGAQAMSTTEVPATHEYYWGEWPCNETSGNGGHLVKVVDGKDVPCQADVVILDNWAMRAMNFQHGHGISNMCTYPRADHGITNYKGSFSAMRALITYAFFFKYMLDNNLDKADGIGADVVIRSELFGDEAPAEEGVTIKTAEELVQFLAAASTCAETDVFTLGSDIDLAGVDITPAASFAGTFDGNGKSIKNMSVQNALFAELSGTVKNLKMENAALNYTGTWPDMTGYALVASKSTGTILNCDINGNIKISAPGTDAEGTKARLYCAGIVGEMTTGTIEGCKFSGSVDVELKEKSRSISSIAGVVARAGVDGQTGKVIVKDCVNEASIKFLFSGASKAMEKFGIGGVIGQTPSNSKVSDTGRNFDCGIIQNVVNRGNIEWEYPAGGSGSYPCLGGVVGAVEGELHHAENYGTLKYTGSKTTAATDASIGGVAGYVTGNASDCHNYGTITLDSGFAGGTALAQNGGNTDWSTFGGVFGNVGPFIANKTNNSATPVLVENISNNAELVLTPRMVNTGGPQMCIAGVIGAATANLKNIVNNKPVTIKTQTKMTNASALVGYLAADMEGGVNKAAVVFDGLSEEGNYPNSEQVYFGGIVGYITKTSKLIRCENHGDVTFQNILTTPGTLSYVGGINGQYTGGFEMIECVNDGTVTSTASNPVCLGGLSGAFNGMMTNCTNSGKVNYASTYVSGTAGKEPEIGGLAGYINASMAGCQSKGEIVAGAGFAGGLAGGCGQDANGLLWKGTTVSCSISGDALKSAVVGRWRDEGTTVLSLGAEGEPVTISSQLAAFPLCAELKGNAIAEVNVVRE